MGRHTTYTEKKAREIIDWISQGKTLRAFCRLPGNPGWVAVYHWQEQNPDFRERFMRARDLGHDAIAEEAYEIADTPVEGVRTEFSAQGTKTIREDMLGHRRLQVDTRLKLLAKWNPRKYGERTSTEISGPNGGPIETKHHTDEMTDADLAAIASRGRAAPAEPPEGED